MLLNKVAETRKTIEEYIDINTKLREARKINSFGEFARIELNKVKVTLGSYHSLHQMDPEFFPKRKLSYEFKQLESLIDSGLEKYNKDDVQAFSRLFKKLEDDLKMRWSHYVLNKNKDIIGLLENLQNIVTNPQEIKQLISELKTFEKKWPVSAITLNRYHEFLSSANKVISDMNASEGIQEFITKVANNQATLDDLTDEVLNWLQTKQLTNKLVIKFK
jgi:hypothetical protein